jgi:dipicolinate synthase subunit A
MNAVNIADIGKHMQRYDCVINTIPKCVLAAGELRVLRDDALVIDIASKPYGIDFEAAKSLNKNVFLEQGLPGKYMPALEAEALGRIIAYYLEG